MSETQHLVLACEDGDEAVLLRRAEHDRLTAIEAAAREYAASRRAWEAMLDNRRGVRPDRSVMRRHWAARANLLALFAPEAGNPARGAGPPSMLDLETRQRIVKRYVHPLMDIERYVESDPTEDGDWDVTVKASVIWDVVNGLHHIAAQMLPEYYSAEALGIKGE